MKGEKEEDLEELGKVAALQLPKDPKRPRLLKQLLPSVKVECTAPIQDVQSINVSFPLGNSQSILSSIFFRNVPKAVESHRPPKRIN